MAGESILGIVVDGKESKEFTNVTFGDEKLILTNGMGGHLFLYYEDITLLYMDVTQELVDIMLFKLSGGGDGVQLLIFPHGRCIPIVGRLERTLHPAAEVFDRLYDENFKIDPECASAIQRLLGSSTRSVVVYSPNAHTQIVITYADMTRLLPDKPLNDGILDFYCQWLLSTLPATVNERIYIFGIYFFKKLLSFFVN